MAQFNYSFACSLACLDKFIIAAVALRKDQCRVSFVVQLMVHLLTRAARLRVLSLCLSCLSTFSTLAYCSCFCSWSYPSGCIPGGGADISSSSNALDRGNLGTYRRNPRYYCLISVYLSCMANNGLLLVSVLDRVVHDPRFFFP